MLASFELALKQLGRAGGCTFEMALSGHESGNPSGQVPMANYGALWPRPVPKVVQISELA